jgi:hypothetical protein
LTIFFKTNVVVNFGLKICITYFFVKIDKYVVIYLGKIFLKSYLWLQCIYCLVYISVMLMTYSGRFWPICGGKWRFSIIISWINGFNLSQKWPLFVPKFGKSRIYKMVTLPPDEKTKHTR